MKIPALFSVSSPGSIDTASLRLDSSAGNDTSRAGVTSLFSSVYNPVSTESRWVEMLPDGKNEAYVGYGNITYIKGSEMSNTRPKYMMPSETGGDPEEIPDYDHPVPASTNGYPVMSIRKQNKSKLNNWSFDGSPPMVPISVGLSTSNGTNSIYTDYMDLNGDRYPDVIGDKMVQYTNPWGGIGGLTALSASVENISVSSTKSEGQTFGASFSLPKRGASGNPKNAKISFDGSGKSGASHGGGEDKTQFIFMDMNGDGLPDKLSGSGRVALNIGYGFLPYETWSQGYAREGSSENAGMNLGGNFNVAQASIGGGIGINISENTTDYSLMDMNGDGLPDKVRRVANNLTVYYNMGNGKWSQNGDIIPIREISHGQSYSESVNGSATGGFTFFGIIKFNIGVQSAPYNRSFSRDRTQITDMNNDGFPDFVTSDAEDNITIRYNQAGKTNLLKRVTNFTGSYIELDYDMPVSSYEQPQRSWNLASIRTIDPYSPAGGNATYKTLDYINPHYDRFERIAYGYEQVRIYEHDTEGNNALYRYMEEDYHNRSFAKRGKKKRDCLYDGEKRPYIETLYEAQLVDMNSGKPVGDEDCPSEVFSMFEAVVKNYYEGEEKPRITTAKSYTYDSKRNVILYRNLGDTALAGDDFIAEMNYMTDRPRNMISLVESMQVKDEQGTLLRQRIAKYNDKGKVIYILQDNNVVGGTELNFDYDQYGNISKMIFPPNENGQRNFYRYVYDDQVHSYPVEVGNALGYSSGAAYDFKWGKPLVTRDINDNIMEYTYDSLGRLRYLRAPYEIEQGIPYTLQMKYLPANNRRFDIFSNHNQNFSQAITLHYDPHNPGNFIHTVLFCDASGRMLQTKKKSIVSNEEVMIVSGKVLYDPFGRTIAQYHPVTEGHVEPGAVFPYNNHYDETTGTYTEYDILDRKTKLRLPDHTETYFKYGFGQDTFAALRFQAVTTDANGNSVITLSDYRQLQTTVIAPLNTITAFEYNPMGELIMSADPDAHSTYYEYDMLGQRISRTHPDAGRTHWIYDPAGNLAAMVTENLLGTGDVVRYKYYFNQLIEIQYPQHPANNVRYTYGDHNAIHDHGVGRVIATEDALSLQTFKYGKLGEVIENNRTFVLPYDDNTYNFTMKWEYDTWNRVKKITYPDGEEVFYAYNRGGMLEQMRGEKGSEQFRYINKIVYNKFESETFIGYGNESTVNYYYDILQRLSHLASSSALGLMQSVNYTYDPVGNIKVLQNYAAPVSNGLGGKSRNEYKYDEQYRLINSQGVWENGYRYGLKMEYMPDGRIIRKSHSSDGNMGYSEDDRYYTYNHSQPHAVEYAGDQQFSWDANGNVVEHKYAPGLNLRRHCWDEENRLTGVADDKRVSMYFYDAAGERTMKLTGYNSWVNVNGVPQGFGDMNAGTLYTSPYLVAGSQGYTKHYYAEDQRIASKLGGGNIVNLDSLPDDFNKRRESKKKHLQDMFVRTKECLGAKTLGVGHQGSWIDRFSEYRALQKTEKEIYFYHPDHLGSSSWITDASGKPIQHLSYLPFGEEFVDQRTSDWSAMYKFTGKEKDEETSYNYFGARYYSSDLSIWLSVDPLSDKYPSLSPYTYCANNPVKLIDPNGMEIWIAGADGEQTLYTPGMKYRGGDKFTRQTVRSLNKLSNGKSSTATSMVNELSGSDNKFTIKSGNNAFTASDAGAYAMKDPFSTENDAYMANIGGGGNISWNSKGTLQMTSNGMRKDATMDLAHELAHGLDANQGVLTGGTTYVNGKIIEPGLVEYRACYNANIIRSEMGQPYQTRYGGNYSFDGYNYTHKGGGSDVVKGGQLILPQHFIKR